MKKTTTTITAKRMAIAVAAVCASLSLPAAANENKAMLDLMLKKGVITQKDYDEFMEADKDAEENRRFKEQRTDQDVSKAVKFLQKNGGTIMRNGIGVQSDDGANSVQLTGRVHMDGRFYSPIYAPGNATDTLTNRLEVRRARFGVRGQFDKDWKYEIVGNFGFANTSVPVTTSGSTSTGSIGADNGMSDATTNIDVAYFDYAANPAAQFRFGKFKMPFSLEQLTSSNNIDFMERSLTNQNEGEFVPAKESGVMLFGSPQAGLTYGLAASVGRGNKNAIKDGVDLIGRGTVNISKYQFNTDAHVMHVGLGFSQGSVNTLTPAMSRTESRGTSGAFTALNSVTTPSRQRANLELAYAQGPFKVQGELFQFGYDGSTGTDQTFRTMYAQAVYNITGENHNYSNTAGTFGWIKPNKPFSATSGGLGAWQVGVRFSSLDAEGVTVQKTSGTLRTDRVESMTVGLTWFVNDNARFMLNYVRSSFGDPVGASGSRLDGERALMLRGQLSF
jgi:phosphate-selective porin OprO/OprP